MSTNNEKELQETFSWARSQVFSDYNHVLGYYQARACLEHARGSSLLDMPCGDGALTAMLAPSFSRLVGVDASSKHLGLARKALPNVEFHEALIEDYETEERFTTVTMLNILEHVVDPIGVLQKAAASWLTMVFSWCMCRTLMR
jgi:2-polyprenyl-3-methyl-5-hydroxy-6-metoxy-1,4-benzoquinol methylase